MEDLVRIEQVKQLIRAGRPASDAAAVFRQQGLTVRQKQLLEEALCALDTKELSGFSEALRLLYYVGVGAGEESCVDGAFRLLSETVQNSPHHMTAYDGSKRIAAGEVSVRLPLRVNWGGTWSDACPYCMERGGAMLNAAITIHGDCPVKVRVRKTPELTVTFVSGDMQLCRAFDSLEQLWPTGDPYDPFALQKACLLACGLIPGRASPAFGSVTLREILTRLGGGFEIHTEVTGVPQGSGLGTSSILSAAVVKALLEFTGTPYGEQTLYGAVLAIEQIMTTGGGWQDQVGGVTPGVKFSTTEPGFAQTIKVEPVELSEETKAELNRRFALIYTGRKRLARSLLREVVGRYIGHEPESVRAHEAIRHSAALMREALERGDIDGFAALMDANWAFNGALSENMNNAAAARLLDAIGDLICARYWCGAGGGGYLQVILKRGVTHAQVRDRLAEAVGGDAALCACELLF